MNQEKTPLPFHGSYFETKVTLRIDSYVQGHGLYIGLDEEGGYPLTDLTVNLPGSRLKQGQAYINHEMSEDFLCFIEQNHLGTVLPQHGFSGYCSYKAVDFDLDRLAELAPEEMNAVKKLWNLQAKQKTTSHEKER